MESFTKQQIETVKAVDMLALAQAIGLQPISRTGKGMFFENPLRNETKPSFSIFQSRSGHYLAKDFGMDTPAMDTITLVQKVQKIGFQDAVKWLLEFDGNNHSFSLTQNNLKYSEGIELRKLLPLNRNKALINYLKSRKINTDFAQRCPLLYECYYRPNGKTRTNGRDFFCLAFENIEKGYDLRSLTFKGKYGVNAYSFISNPKSQNIAVFEGFIDYLSALTYYQTPLSRHNVLILNSTENKSKALPKLHTFKKVFLFLDNDDAGRKATAFLQDNLSHAFDHSDLYRGCEDFNEFIR